MGSLFTDRHGLPWRHGPAGWRGRVPVRFVVAAVLAVVAGALAAGAVQRAGDVSAAYGTTIEVPVATRDLSRGDVVGAADVEVRSVPAGLVARGVATDVVGRTVAEAMAAGEVVLEIRMGGAGGGPGALLEGGTRAIGLPRSPDGVAVAVGDRVDVLAPDDATAGATARRVARGAEVLEVGDTAFTVAVTVNESGAVARAVLDGAVTVALVGPAG